MNKLIHNTQIKYPKTHWVFNWHSKFLIKIVSIDNFVFAVSLNPTDARGYRTIVRYISDNVNDIDNNIENTLNREYTYDETIALLTVTARFSECFKTYGLLPQIEIAGNNYNYFKDNKMFIGTKDEPCMLHSHIINRGIPYRCYIATDVPLLGPLPGDLFNMREGKIKWNTDQIASIIISLREKYDSLFESS